MFDDGDLDPIKKKKNWADSIQNPDLKQVRKECI